MTHQDNSIGILARPDSWYFHDLQRAARQWPDAGEVCSLSFGSLTAALCPEPRISTAEVGDLTQLRAVLVRTMPAGTLEQIVFRMNALHRLAALGTNVVNAPRCLEIAVDKYLALAQLQAAGLTVPSTRTAQTWEQAMNDYEELGRDVVVKPLFGSEGRGMLRVCDEASAWRVFKTLSQLGHVISQQAFVSHEGCDLRILRVGEELFGMRRINPHDFRTNVSQGATTEPFKLTSQLMETAYIAANAVGAIIAGVDILPGRDGRQYVLEVNAVPGWRALARTLQVDIGAKVLQLIVNCSADGTVPRALES